MSLVHLSNACSHLQNASLARLGLTSLPRTNQLHSLLLSLQKSGYVNSVTVGGPSPPPPSPLSPLLSANTTDGAQDISGHVILDESASVPTPSSPPATSSNPSHKDIDPTITTRSNIASRRLWIGLKYYNHRPVLETMRVVSKPTRRIWMGTEDLEGLLRGQKRGYVKGLGAIGEALFLSTDRGVMEVREAVEKRVGGMILCRVNSV